MTLALDPIPASEPRSTMDGMAYGLTVKRMWSKIHSDGQADIDNLERTGPALARYKFIPLPAAPMLWFHE